jgi:uncharacterized protein
MTGGTLAPQSPYALARVSASEGNTPMPLEAGLLDILACPACHAPLREEPAPEGAAGTGGTEEGKAPEGATGGELVCTGPDCGLAYPVRDDIPVLLVDEARRPA